MVSKTASFYWFLALQAVPSEYVSGESLPGPCRVWYQSCDTEIGWVCTSEKSYQEPNQRPWMKCSYETTPPAQPPYEQCRIINDTCQFTNSTLECNSNCEFGQYTCEPVNNSEQSNPSVNCQQFSNGLTVPTPDKLCLPVDEQCQWYNPCRYWKGHCSGPYRCGTSEEYFSFIFGPMPSCMWPPEGYVEPIIPGECLVKDDQCKWSVCEAYIDWCNTHWTCGTEYDAAVYRASPPPPCPHPPLGYIPPSQPGVCLFNETLGRCTFQEESARLDEDGSSHGLFIGLATFCGVVVVFVFIVVILIIYFVVKKRILKKFASGKPSNEVAMIHADNPLSGTDSFKYSELRKDNVSENSEG